MAPTLRRSPCTVPGATGWRGKAAWLPVPFGLQTGHPARAFGFGPPFQLGNPLFQALDDRLLPDDPVPLLDDQGNQSIPVGSPEIDSCFHSRYMT